MSDGSTSLPLGSVLSLIMCDRKGKCCSQDFSGSLYINYMFPTHHACQPIVFVWSELFAGRDRVMMELTGTGLTFVSNWIRLYLVANDRWIYCDTRDVRGDRGPVYMDFCLIEMRY